MNTIESSLLHQMGLGKIDIAFIFIGVIFLFIVMIIIMIIMNMKIKKLNNRLNIFMLGKDASSLEDNIKNLFNETQYLKELTENNKKDVRKIIKNLQITYQKMGLVKYDAFNQMGGKLSFSLALLNENNDGFILNSVHSSEGCYTYTKEIKAGISSLLLGKEEEEALNIAMDNRK